MVERFEFNHRRILKFPVIHPFPIISPATLLDSLITLSDTITDYHSKFFATQKRNSREAIRQIRILSIFFQEIRQTGGGGRLILSDSVTLCFSELQIVFQKLILLLDDCTREGARLWILMRSHFVATQFRSIIRSMATALDVLSLDFWNVSYEVVELVEMVAKQAREAKMEISPDDECAMNRVILILNQFENRFEPDKNIILQVLDHLGIRCWRECHQEIKFLEEEISLEFLENNEGGVALLGSLLGFMCYCRGVLFENSVFQNNDQVEGRSNAEMMPSWLNPEDFRCPISLELMTDPVTISTGQTYDRVSIQKWFKSGNLLCPNTGDKLTSTEMVSNLILRKLIQQYSTDDEVSLVKSRKKNCDISRTVLPSSPAAAEAIKFLSKSLAKSLTNGRDEDKNKAAYEIRLLAKSNIFNRDSLIESGCIPPLLPLLISPDPSTQENAIAALLKLSKHPNGKKVIVQNNGLNFIVSVLRKGLHLDSRELAGATIFYLSSVDMYRPLIGEKPKVFQGLVNLIKEGTSCGKKNALIAVYGILLHSMNHSRAIAAGIVPLLVNLISSSDRKELVSDSLAVLAILSESFEGSDAILKVSALSIIIKTLHSSASRSVKVYCVSILVSLRNNFETEVIAILAKETLLMASLYSLSASIEMVPNLILRKLIQQYFTTYHEVSLAKSRKMNRDISRTILPGSPAAAEAIKFLSKFLAKSLNNGEDEDKNKAANEIRLLAKSNIFNRESLIESGCIPSLLPLLTSTDPSTQENAIAALLKLSKHSNGKKLIIQNNGLNFIVSVLREGLRLESRQLAGAIIFYLSSVDKYRLLIGETPKVFQGFVNLIKEGTRCGKKNALVALYGILLHPMNHKRAIAAGIVPLLINLISSSDKKELISDSLAVLAILSESFDGSNAILDASALSIIIKTLLSSASRSAKEYSVSVLVSLSNNFEMEVIAILAKETLLIASLYLLSTKGTSQVKSKVQSLIKRIHRFYEISRPDLMAN